MQMTDEEFANLFRDDNDEQIWLTVPEFTKKINDLPERSEPPICQHQGDVIKVFGKVICCKCGEKVEHD